MVVEHLIVSHNFILLNRSISIRFDTYQQASSFFVLSLCDLWKTILGHEWGVFPIIVTSDEVMNENHRQIASRVTQKSLFTVTNALLYFAQAIIVLNTQCRLKHLSIADFVIVAKDGPLWPSIVTSPQLIYDVTRTLETAIVTSY